MIKQRTITRAFTLDGVGVHTGASTSVTVGPAPANSGVVFLRTDLGGARPIPALLDNVRDLRRGTSLGSDGAEVGTVEHLLAALSSSKVDNALVEVDGPEVPVRDGSFSDFHEAVVAAGSEEQDADAHVLELESPVVWRGRGGTSYAALPAPELEVAVSIEYPHSLIGRQYGHFRAGADFPDAIAPARTFGFRSDAAELHAAGRALGASPENTVVIGEEGEPAPELRFPDEFVRHKAGDLLGDLALLGGRLHAKIVAERPGHEGNVEFARRLRLALVRDSRKPVLDVTAIMKFLPHRYPMLLVDRITDYEPGRKITGIKNVTINEAFFQGHYPGHPVMPGVLIVEAMAQVGGLLLMDEVKDPQDKVVYFMSLDKVKWRRPVTPGDTLVFELELTSLRGRNCRMKGRGFVDDVMVAQAELMARIVDK